MLLNLLLWQLTVSIQMSSLCHIYPRGSNHWRRSINIQRTVSMSHVFTFHFAYLWNISYNINGSLFTFDSLYASFSCFLSLVTLLVVNLKSHYHWRPGDFEASLLFFFFPYYHCHMVVNVTIWLSNAISWAWLTNCPLLDWPEISYIFSFVGSVATV